MILPRLVPLILPRLVPLILLRLVLIASGKPSHTKSWGGRQTKACLNYIMHLLKNPISYCKWPKKVQANLRSKKGSQRGPETQLGFQDTNKTDISNVVQDPKKVLSLIAFSNLCDFDK